MTITPSKARKKPVEIEVVQYIPGLYTRREWEEWCPKANIGTRVQGENGWEAALDETEFVWFSIETLEGAMEVLPLAYVAKGVEGEFYPIAESIFMKTYNLTEVEGVKVIMFDHNIVT